MTADDGRAHAPGHAARPTLSEWLGQGPFSLTLSSGFFGFFAHAGLLTELEDAGHLPRRLSGSSAGALSAGAWAAGLDARRFAASLLALERRDFWDPRPGAGLLAGRLFRERLIAELPVHRFESCRAPLAVSTFDLAAARTRVLASGDLPRALHASCAVPFLFHPVFIDGRPHLDGGIADRPGIQGMPAGERVLFHHLLSGSRFRRRGSPSLMLPRRAGLVSLILGVMPRVGPLRLEVGAAAYESARAATRRALTLPIEGDLVRVA
jgi:NTE family protein